MSRFHKVIKYCALAFSVFLIVSIFAGIASGFNIVSEIFSDDSENLYDDLKTLKIVNEEISELNIKLNASELVIKSGEELKVETNNKKISIKEKNTEVIISEKNNNILNKETNSKLVVTLPEGYLFNIVDIESGAGKINIESLNTKTLEFELGAGKVDITNLNVSDSAEIESGAGNVNIKSGIINNLNLDVGVGVFTLNSKLIGNNKISAGVGSLKVNLDGSIDDYNLKVSKGIGTIKLNNETIKDNKVYGNGNSYITIEGGIGDISIKTNINN